MPEQTAVQIIALIWESEQLDTPVDEVIKRIAALLDAYAGHKILESTLNQTIYLTNERN